MSVRIKHTEPFIYLWEGTAELLLDDEEIRALPVGNLIEVFKEKWLDSPQDRRWFLPKETRHLGWVSIKHPEPVSVESRNSADWGAW